ncbi:MAG TPA: PDZ domain-containing protein [Stellaceae bacterium]|nr:PDZ domain-containing protein [Stellaceae bacterium]
MRPKYLAARALALLLAGCQAAAPGPQGPVVHPDALAAAPAKLGRLYVYRVDSSVMDSKEFRIWVNGAEVGGITSGTYLYLDLKPGTYSVSAGMRQPGGPEATSLSETANVSIDGPGSYYVRISHISLGTEIAAGVLVAALAGAAGAAAAGAASHAGGTVIYPAPVIAPAGPPPSSALHPEVVPADKAAPELQALAYAKPADNPLPNQPARLGLSYAMTDGSGTPHPAIGGLVTLVLPDTAAARAGILAGDVLVSIGGTTIDSDNSVRAFVRKATPGTAVPIVLYRDGTKMELTAVL